MNKFTWCSGSNKITFPLGRLKFHKMIWKRPPLLSSKNIFGFRKWLKLDILYFKPIIFYHFHSLFFLFNKVWCERVVANGNHDLGSRTSNQVSYPLFLPLRFSWLLRSLSSVCKTPLLSVSYIPFLQASLVQAPETQESSGLR